MPKVAVRLIAHPPEASSRPGSRRISLALDPVKTDQLLWSPSRRKLLAFLPGRTDYHDTGYKLVCHAEQVAQHVGIDTSQANENGVIVDIVIRQVVNIRGSGEQLGAIIQIHANDKRIRFGREVSGHACQKFSVDLERREPVRCALLHAGQPKADIPYHLKVDFSRIVFSAHGSLLIEMHTSF